MHILPSDKTANDTNFLVCFIDLTFKFEGNGDSLEQSLVPIWLGNSIERTNGAVSTMKTFRIFNNGVYGFENEHF
ncbi:hypothetical protein FACS1894166_12540 [Bacilli bacterium]|nr:hypothetical protein FACS1894166_12540 [Bacilli bacterium]